MFHQTVLLLTLCFVSICTQLFRRGHPQLCRQMRFSPPPDLNVTKSMAPTTPPSGRAASILRVPSLTSTTGSSEHRPHLEDGSSSEVRKQHTRNNSVATDLTLSTTSPATRSPQFGSHGWTSSPSGMHGVNAGPPPVFVNYRPEEMHLAREAWQFYGTSKTSPHHHPAHHPGQWMPSEHGALRTQGMPPYSPIRIRSARGARRLTLHGTPSRESPPLTAAAAAATRGFVSNRGKGRRVVASTLSSQTRSNAANEDVEMLASQQQQQQPEESNTKEEAKDEETPAPSPPPKAEKQERPRPTSLKRKLPFAATKSSSTAADRENK